MAERAVASFADGHVALLTIHVEGRVGLGLGASAPPAHAPDHVVVHGQGPQACAVLVLLEAVLAHAELPQGRPGHRVQVCVVHGDRLGPVLEGTAQVPELHGLDRVALPQGHAGVVVDDCVGRRLRRRASVRCPRGAAPGQGEQRQPEHQNATPTDRDRSAQNSSSDSLTGAKIGTANMALGIRNRSWRK